MYDTKLRVIERRRRVAELAAQGLDNGQIAAAMGLHRDTVYQDRKENELNPPPDVDGLYTTEQLCDLAGMGVTPRYFCVLLKRYGIKPACSYGNTNFFPAEAADQIVKAVAETREKKRRLLEEAAEARRGKTATGATRYLTEDEINKLDYLCERVADGERAVDVALTMGITERQLRGLYNRAKIYGYDYLERVARLYVDKCELARKQHRPVPSPPAPSYSIAIRLEASRRGVPCDAVAVYDFTGWDARMAERNKAYWRRHLHAEEMARYNEIAELKVKLYNKGGCNERRAANGNAAVS